MSHPRWTASGRHIPTDSLALSWSEIEQIQRPAGTRTGEGAAIGAAVGLGAGLIAGLLSAENCSGEELCGLEIVILPLFTVPVGALAGALIGSAHPRCAPFFCAPSAPHDIHGPLGE